MQISGSGRFISVPFYVSEVESRHLDKFSLDKFSDESGDGPAIQSGTFVKVVCGVWSAVGDVSLGYGSPGQGTAGAIGEQPYIRYEELGIVMDNSSLSPDQDPSLIQAARVIYETYYSVHPSVTDLPLGVAINRFTFRGKLIFNGKPILLPQECFIPFSTIDAR